MEILNSDKTDISPGSFEEFVEKNNLEDNPKALEHYTGALANYALMLADQHSIDVEDLHQLSSET